MYNGREVYGWGVEEELDEKYVLTGERNRLLLERQDLEWMIKEVANKKKAATRHCILGVLLTIVMILFTFVIGGVDIFINPETIMDNLSLTIKILLLIEVFIMVVVILIYVIAMINNNLFIAIADFFKIEKLQMKYESYKKQMKIIDTRVGEINKILDETKNS